MTFEFLLLLIQWPESLEINSEPGWLATGDTAQWAHTVKASQNVEAPIHSYFTKQSDKTSPTSFSVASKGSTLVAAAVKSNSLQLQWCCSRAGYPSLFGDLKLFEDAHEPKLEHIIKGTDIREDTAKMTTENTVPKRHLTVGVLCFRGISFWSKEIFLQPSCITQVLWTHQRPGLSMPSSVVATHWALPDPQLM